MAVTRIFGQRYDANGNQLGSNFRVDDDPGHYWKTAPAIVIAPDGSFFIVWDDYRETDQGIFGQRFSKDRFKLEGNFKINDDGTNYESSPPAIVVNSEGKYIAPWCDYRQADHDILGQHSNADSPTSQGHYRVNQVDAATEQLYPKVAYVGNIVYRIWHNNHFSGQDWDVGYRLEQPLARTLHVLSQLATIQAAIEAASDADAVRLARGFYNISASILNDRVNN